MDQSVFSPVGVEMYSKAFVSDHCIVQYALTNFCSKGKQNKKIAFSGTPRNSGGDLRDPQGLESNEFYSLGNRRVKNCRGPRGAGFFGLLMPSLAIRLELGLN